MSFSLEGSNIIRQSGEDTSLSGLAGLAGVAATSYGQSANSYTVYDIGVKKLFIAGNLTINPEVELLVQNCNIANAIVVVDSASLSIGSPIISNGSTRYSVGEAIHQRVNAGNGYSSFSLEVRLGGTLNWYGGVINSKGGVGLREGSICTIREGVFISSKNLSFRLYSSSISIKGLKVINARTIIYNNFTDLEGLQTIQADTPATASLNAGGLVLYGPSSGYTSNSNTIVISGYEATGSIHNILLIDGVKVDIKNALYGSVISIASWYKSINLARSFGYARITKDVMFSVRNDLNEPIEGVKIFIQDYNGGNRKNAHGFDDLQDNLYTLTTNSLGLTEEDNIIIAIVNKDTQNDSGQVATDYRSKYNNNTDIFDCFVWGYKFSSSVVTIEAKGSKVLLSKSVLIEDASISQTSMETVQNYTGLHINHQTQTIAITHSYSLDNLYDFIKFNKLSNLGSPTNGTMAATTFGSELHLTYNVVISDNSVLSAGTKFLGLDTTGTVTIDEGSSVTCSYFDNTFDTIVTLSLASRFDTVSIHATAADSDNNVNPIFTGSLIRFNVADHAGNNYYARFSHSSVGVESAGNLITMPTSEGMVSYDFTFGENSQLTAIATKLIEFGNNLETVNNNVKDASLLIPAGRDL